MSEPTRRELLAAGALGLGAAGLARGQEAPRYDSAPGEHALRFELSGVEIGCALDPRGPTGVSVLRFPRRALCVADVRGGGPATSFVDVARDSGAELDAICFAGGAVYGLAAADGVRRALWEERRGSVAWEQLARVSAAAIYDLPAQTAERKLAPDAALGRAALAAARPGVAPRGARGAGASASAGKWFPRLSPELTGQGAAFRRAGKTRVLVLSVVNPLGALVDRRGRVVRGHLDPKTGERQAVGPGTIVAPQQAPRRGNTTLTAVVTNRRLTPYALRQLAREVHTSMARAIHPFHGLSDGDVLFAATTAELDDPGVNAYQLAALGSACAWDAVLSSFLGR